MASRNVKPAGSGLGLYDPAEKLQSNTLKRHPKMDLNKTDLLRLLSYLEGELQARDVVIATMKAEKAKQLFYQAKYGRFGLGDPFSALQRDSDNMKDNSFDESAIKSMYDNQLAQLENLIATQRKAQLKMREQLSAAEKRYHKVCNELEDEKRKHAQDTAQGDDVTYMLEKERERLRQEIEYEKSQNKKIEKDLKKTLVNLEEERANSIKHKQVAVMLIKEQKKLIEKLVKDRQKIQKLEQQLQDERTKTSDVVEGLVIESKKSLKMEAVMERQISDFDTEREQLKNRLSKEETKNRDLAAQIESLQQQLELLQKQLSLEKSTASKDSFQSIEIKSTAHPSRPGGERGGNMAVVSPNQNLPKTPKLHDSSTHVMETRTRGNVADSQNPMRYSHSPERHIDSYRTDAQEMRIAPVGAVSIDKSLEPTYRGGTRIGMQPGSTTLLSSSGGKILTVNVSHPNPPGSPVNMSPRKAVPTGRGTPPPLPPNKPSLSSPIPVSPIAKSAVPAKSATSQESLPATPRGVHIPVSVVHSPATVTRGGTGDAKSTPIRKPTQLPDGHTDALIDTSSPHDFSSSHLLPQNSTSSHDAVKFSTSSHDALEFLGPEMADLQNLLSSIMEDSDNSLNVTGSSPSFIHDINSPIHKLAAEGKLESLQKLILESEADVNLPIKDGSTPLLFAAKYGHEECVRFLLENGAQVFSTTDNKFTALHAASADGHVKCLELLLEGGANPNAGDYQNWTPLHLAATQNHIQCCQILMDYGAKLNVCSMTTWTPLHSVVHADHGQCLKLLLEYHSKLPWTPGHVTLQELVDIPDNDGWTVIHVAASKNSMDCLSVISKFCDIDVTKTDRWRRSVLDVATPICCQFLNQIDNYDVPVPVIIEINYARISGEDNSSSIQNQRFAIGNVQLTKSTSWSELESHLQTILTGFFSQLDTGLKTKKTSRLDPEITSDSMQYTLGLGLKSIHSYFIGSYHWVAGLHSVDNLPFDIMCNNISQNVGIVIEGNIEAVSCDVLFPVSVLHNYLRLLEHYKSVVFYGPESTGKSYIAHRLAHFVAKREQQEGKKSNIQCIRLHENLTHQEFVQILISTGCMLKVGSDYRDTTAPIVVMENLENVNLAALFGKLLTAIEHRGQYHRFTLEGSSTDDYFFVDKFYLIATMNRSRSTGLDLSIQQRFRWVHFRIDVEPIRNFLARYFLRKFLHVYDGKIPTDSLVFRAVEWVLCIWQRLNDGLGKLGIPDTVFGPCWFLTCPIETQDVKKIHGWMCDVWNDRIAPNVRDAVIKGTGKDTSSGGQQKVANTALYVLLQKAIVPGCPLSGPEKDQYLSTFSGSNELEIPIKSEMSKTPVSNGNSTRRSMGANGKKESPIRYKHRKSMDDKDTELLTCSIKRRSLSETSIKNSIEGSHTEINVAKMPKLEIRTPAMFSFVPKPAQEKNFSGYQSDTKETTPVKNFSGYQCDTSETTPKKNFSGFQSDTSETTPGKKFSGYQSNSSEIEPRWDRGGSGYQSDTTETPLRTFSFSAIPKKPGQNGYNDNSGSIQSHTRRARSSENLLESSDTKQKSPGLFSFSLTTPTSSLSSFEFLEVKSRSGSKRSGTPRSSNGSQSQSPSSFSGSPASSFVGQSNSPEGSRMPENHIRNGRAQNDLMSRSLPQNNTNYFTPKMPSSHSKNPFLPQTESEIKNQELCGQISGEQFGIRRNDESPFQRNSRLRRSIEDVLSDSRVTIDRERLKSLPDSPLAFRDSERQKNAAMSESPFVRNSSGRKSLEKMQNPFLHDPEVQRSLGGGSINKKYVQDNHHKHSLAKHNNSLESEC